MSSNFVSGDEIPVQDNDYVTKNEEIPVQDDLKEVEDPIDENVADSDEQLAKDESEAIDTSNIIKERTRHAKPQTENGYNEGPSEEDLPPA
ncbi:hypothetical protein POX_e07006 [Penicillium oxalicum]|uniref:Histone chaperone domain-containing protein n=1 Tax=Penicillium oxalicum (strain 114-2 / CGMCC 5302) TaxID=933388 RepID=S7ZBQ5_PENO1|nr:hypothetical protein POX_e07006 [Penicillium oxalicum]EPS28035.1 hypothetical protein PDE_02980 [Penicillium oxalicum 114-2]KAI2788981.1 hypothetical protein POX_e07006 [Penicillium oxalicum]